jgi:predicted HicB family RNase H-like nuclease
MNAVAKIQTLYENKGKEKLFMSADHKLPPRKGVSIRPHKGGRTERLEIRIEPEVKRLLLDHISQTGESYSDWITRKVKEDLEKNLSA